MAKVSVTTVKEFTLTLSEKEAKLLEQIIHLPLEADSMHTNDWAVVTKIRGALTDALNKNG